MHGDLGQGGKSYVNLVRAKAAGTVEETKILRGSERFLREERERKRGSFQVYWVIKAFTVF